MKYDGRELETEIHTLLYLHILAPLAAIAAVDEIVRFRKSDNVGCLDLKPQHPSTSFKHTETFRIDTFILVKMARKICISFCLSSFLLFILFIFHQHMIFFNIYRTCKPILSPIRQTHSMYFKTKKGAIAFDKLTDMSGV